MTTIADPSWAIQQLDSFIALTDLVPLASGRPGRQHAGSKDELNAQATVVERIFLHLDPQWRDQLEMSMNPDQAWNGHRTLAIRAKTTILKDEEIRQKLGDNAPQISASSLHPWAWEGARSLWQSGHFREAVTAAARKINAETQNKLKDRTRSETQLFQDALSASAPTVGHPRLRVVPDDGSATFKSMQRGVMAFAEGCYAAIRNPNSHAADLPELTEHEGLEQLAAFSQLARWIEGASVETAP
ncbi:TIGR02391 family protein [Streptomyces sp. BSE7-9]|uniref:TIGR02391 family protein n=1 Tax=Streptomyces sp. BSE7-9 TaxID=2759948 RepID=UPI0018EE88BC|nr:TIGR02391 family protein [Streptomyces sp. BSE7-9]